MTRNKVYDALETLINIDLPKAEQISVYATHLIRKKINYLMQTIIDMDAPIINTHNWNVYGRSEKKITYICVDCGIFGSAKLNTIKPSMLGIPYLSCNEMKMKHILK